MVECYTQGCKKKGGNAYFLSLAFPDGLILTMATMQYLKWKKKKTRYLIMDALYLHLPVQLELSEVFK